MNILLCRNDDDSDDLFDYTMTKYDKDYLKKKETKLMFGCGEMY